MDEILSPDQSWSVWRQDDHGRRFEMQRGMTQSEAEKMARQYEERGHKQTYFVEPTSGGDGGSAGTRTRIEQ